ncbi:hypothetical protein [Pseudoalteromonas tunicata]|nr:hypothetical protein [Pseudoalteromonas tunicata]MDP4983481.1 hypothetical protein [Pseudoalteromonas tunicata]MDP5215104.1 hypothetical protein [Pseudoalteromonas tunicata]
MATPEILCDFSIKSASANEAVLLTFSVHNQTSQIQSVLTWQTPLEGFWSEMFIIKDENNQDVIYQGPLAKRGQPAKADYLNLAPQEKTMMSLVLSDAYALKKGRYQLTIAPNNLHLAQLCQAYTFPITFRVK